MTRCLIVQHVAPEGPYAIGRALEAAGVVLERCRVDAGDQLPDRPGRYDGVVVMGGPMSATSDAGFSTRRRELDLLAEAVEHGVPTLGVCLGAQLLAQAVGGSVFAGEAGPEVGWAPVELSAEAATDLLLSGAPVRPTVLHWHGDTFEPPPGSVLLASSERYPHQAFRVGDRAWGLQFHVEVDAVAVDAFVEAFGEEARRAGTDPRDILDAAPARLEALASLRDGVADRFAALVAGSAAPAGRSAGLDQLSRT